MYTEEVSGSVARVAKFLDIRARIEPSIIAAIYSFSDVIIVGRHLRKTLPEIPVLYIKMTDDEVERRCRQRDRTLGTSVTDRNHLDLMIASSLGLSPGGEGAVDVTFMSPSEQAEVLRRFISRVETS